MATTVRQRLVQRREELGLTQEDVANALRANVRTIARYESGESKPRPGQRPRLAKVLQWSTAQLALALNDDDLPTPSGQVVPAWLTLYASLEQGAAQIWAYQPVTVHALLQTEDYARAVEREGIGPTPPTEAEVARLVDLRLSRQRVLTREPDPLRLSVVLDQSVLQRVTGGHDVMAAQLEHLVLRAERSNVDLRILPLDPGVHAAAFGSFTMLASLGASDPQMVCLEDRTGHRYLEAHHAISAHQIVFDHLCHRSLSPADSLELIQKIAKEKYQ